MTIIKKPTKARPDPEDWHYIVQAIARAVEKKNLSTYQIADLTGLKQQNVSRVFSLKYSPTLKVLQKIADAVGVEIVVQQKTSIRPPK